jgi:tetratricopeptide (TPR) repeat protein
MPRETRSGNSPPAGFLDRATGSHSSENGIFCKEGEYWTLGYGGQSFRLKDSKGLGYLAHLLRHPGVEFHVLDLAGGIAGQRDDDEQGLPHGPEDLDKAGIQIGGLGDAGEMLDEQAKIAYRRRLSDLREELEEAKEHGNVGRAEQAEQEIDALTTELSRAVGLGGRSRRAASASERARQSVAKTIKSVLDRIGQSDPRLAGVLARTIKTGNFCSYQLDPELLIEWEFAAVTIEPVGQPSSSGDRAPGRADDPQNPLNISPFLLAERTAFVGRESECRAIRAVIDRARVGHGSVVMLWDGPGVGKTRLAMEMAEYASRSGFRCSVGHCYERDEPHPYLPFAEIIENNLAQAPNLEVYRDQMGPYGAELAQIAPGLRRIFPDLPQPLELPAGQQRGYLFQSLAESMARAARIRPCIYLLEDLHWADESTLALLAYLANRVAQLPAVIIGTYRSGYSDINPALVRTLEELIRIGVRPHKLSGLSKNAVAQMLQRLSDRAAPESLVNLIFEESQGYPFFVEEVYRHLTEEGKVFDAAGHFRSDLKIDEIEVPENVRLIISRRLERLDESEKQALTAAAVIGRSFSFQLLTAVSQIDIDELFTILEKAQRMGIVVPSSEGPQRPFTFTHELVRQTLLAGISAPRRQRLHAAVADATERLYPDEGSERAGEIADHLVKAGSFADSRRVVSYLTLAGKNALEAAAFEEARRNFQSAISYQGTLDLKEKAELLVSLATAERGLDLWEMVVANLREAFELYIDLADREAIVRTVIWLTDALCWVGNLQEGIETARRALTYPQAEVSAERARLLSTLGGAYSFAGVYEPAQEALRQALEIARQLSDSKLEASVLDARSLVNLQFLRVREIVTDGLLSEQLGGSALPPWQHAMALLCLHVALLQAARPEEALRIAEELEPLARKIGHSLSVAYLVATRAWIDFGKAPDLDELETGFQRPPKSDQDASFPVLEVTSEIGLTIVDFFRGNWTGALLHAQTSRRLGPDSIEGVSVGTLFRQLAYAGDRNGAFAVLDENRPLLPLSGQSNAFGSWFMLWLVVEGLVMLGEHSQAGELYPLVCELVDTGAVALWPICRFTRTVAGMAAAAAHQWDAAEEHFQIAMQQAESFPYLLEQAEIRRFQAMMLMDRAARGDREKAQTLLNEALQSYTQIGMPRHIEMTQKLLDQSGG